MPGNNELPSSNYNCNSFKEIKSHSSILYNERMAILFYILDMNSIALNRSYKVEDLLEVRALLKQIYKNIRMLIRSNPYVRIHLNLETKDKGIYITDVMFATIDKMIDYCSINGYTPRKIYIITNHLNELEIIIKDVLQYFSYFIRPDFKQKPDIEIATQRYKEQADELTLEELRSIVGKNNHIDFEHLGTSKVTKDTIIEYDDVDDSMSDDEDD